MRFTLLPLSSFPFPLPGVWARWLGIQQPSCSHEPTSKTEVRTTDGRAGPWKDSGHRCIETEKIQCGVIICPTYLQMKQIRYREVEGLASGPTAGELAGGKMGFVTRFSLILRAVTFPSGAVSPLVFPEPIKKKKKDDHLGCF